MLYIIPMSRYTVYEDNDKEGEIVQPWIWALVIAAFLILEFMTYQLVSIWLAGGSVVGLILSFFDVPPWVQFAASLAVAIVLLVFTRRIVKKWLEVKGNKINLDAFENKEVLLLTDITQAKIGTVKIDGVVWNASSDHPIKAGEWVTILRVDGNKLIVEAAKNQHNKNA